MKLIVETSIIKYQSTRCESIKQKLEFCHITENVCYSHKSVSVIISKVTKIASYFKTEFLPVCGRFPQMSEVLLKNVGAEILYRDKKLDFRL